MYIDMFIHACTGLHPHVMARTEGTHTGARGAGRLIYGDVFVAVE